jgi:cyclic 2,3-diphosphoglycerate synthase
VSRVLALIDGEHYPPVVRFALNELARDHDLLGAVFIGGTEKIDLSQGTAEYGVPLITGTDPEAALEDAFEHFAPDVVVDLSDEPVVTDAERLRLACIALEHGAAYHGADFAFDPPSAFVRTRTPALAIVGTGKRVGKTAISAHVARSLKRDGRDVVVLAMGRGGPARPELIRGDEVRLTTADLIALARQGVHASSDNYEDAVMSRVATVGCRRCGGGMAGATFFSNVPEGALLADSLGKELIVLEGSGAAVPPVRADATVLVVGAGRGVTYVRDYFGPYRISRADLVVIAGAEEPAASSEDVAALRAEIARQRPSLPVVAVTFRPEPIEPVAGRRVFFATTAPSAIAGSLAEHLEREHGCDVVAVSTHLSDRAALRHDLATHAGDFDLLLTELKAAAIDVVATAGEEAGVETVLCDNVPVTTDGSDLTAGIARVADLAVDRGRTREGGKP